MQGLGARFALEAGFLIALAIGLGIADLSTTVIVVVMAAAWLLVSLFELAVWAEGSVPARQRQAVAEEPDELTPRDTVEPAAITEIREPEPEPDEGRRRFWRRRRAVSGGA